MEDKICDLLNNVKNIIKKKNKIEQQQMPQDKTINFEIGKTYEGFEMLEKSFIQEIDSEVKIFEHKKTGAKLVSLKNTDENKVFCISFKTIPEDDTGVAHILEHCVIQGSTKYPAKNTFAELGKGAYSTYLNAITGRDITKFPVATTNEEELFNMMDVYMDAVFYPNVYKEPNIFKQEGWRYEFDKNGKLNYNGVVFNEMNGVISNREREKVFLKDTTYQYDSGGNPEKITDLTYEKLLEFHKKYYHPSNSYIYLYGDGNLKEQLRFLDSEYLRNFDKKEVNIQIKDLKPLKEIETIEYEYQVDKSIDKDIRNISLNWIMDKKADAEFIESIDILLRLLLSKEENILKQNIVERDICKTLTYNSIVNNINKPIISVCGTNCSVDNTDNFKNIFFETLNQILDKKIDKNEAKEIIKQKRFDYKIPSVEMGIEHCNTIMANWVNGVNPIDILDKETSLKKIEEYLDNGYFEKKLKRWFIDNKNCVFAIGKPNYELLDERQKRITQKLENIEKNLKEDEKNRMKKEAEQFRKYQLILDTEESYNKIPRISLQNIDRKAKNYKVIEENLKNEKILFYPSNIKDIVSAKFMFDLKGVEQELLPYIPLMQNLLNMKISTKNYSYTQVADLVKKDSKEINFGIENYVNCNKKDTFYPKFTAMAMFDKKYTKESFDILNEIISNTVFDKDIDISRIKRFLEKKRINFKSAVNSDPFAILENYFDINYNELTKYKNELYGANHYKIICQMEKDFDRYPEKVIEKLNEVKQKVFNKQNLLTNIITDKKTYSSVKKDLAIFIDNLNDNGYEEVKYNFKENYKRLGIVTSSNVNYIAHGYNFRKLGYENNGRYQMIAQILNDYLYNESRVKNGAYGCWSEAGNTCLSMISYRDPNIKETLNTYKNAGEYLKNINLSEKELEKYKIATLKDFDKPRTVYDKNDIAVTDYISGISSEDKQKQRDEILFTTLASIRDSAELVNDITKQNCFCVVGNKEQIEQQSFLFNKVVYDITKDNLSKESVSTEREL